MGLFIIGFAEIFRAGKRSVFFSTSFRRYFNTFGIKLDLRGVESYNYLAHGGLEISTMVQSVGYTTVSDMIRKALTFNSVGAFV